MRFCLLTILIVLVSAAGMVGCQTSRSHGRGAGKSFPMLDAATASTAGLSTKEVSDAIQLGNTKCIRCHGFYDPTAYGDAEWRTWMSKMSKKARLSVNQRELLSHYLDAVRSSTNVVSTNGITNPYPLNPKQR